MADRVDVIVTVPPYSDFAGEVAAHPICGGLRLNTVMPTKGGLEPILKRLAGLGVPLWIDLKGRQLRVVGAAIPPFTEVRVSHPLTVRTPTPIYFDDGREEARLIEVDGDRLILEDGPRRLVGPGESINIPCPSLRIEGTLTATDRAYIEAACAIGLHDYMLSYVEDASDIEELRSLDKEAQIVAKIESQKGMDYARTHGTSQARIMAARGDLYVEVSRPHRILSCLRELARIDPTAIAASRILVSLAHHAVPEAQDITDVAYLYGIGYRTFMLGDEVCMRRDSVLPALNLLEAIAAEVRA